MAASCLVKRPAGFFAVPLNIRCSRKCAMPDFPAVSSAAPTRYHSMWVTTGVRWSGMTTTARPLSNVNCATLVAAVARGAGASRTAHRQRVSEARIRALDKVVPSMRVQLQGYRPLRGIASGSLLPNRTIEDGGNLPAVAVFFTSRIGRSRRWCLVTRRRLGQLTARRFTGEGRRLAAVAAHQPVPTKDAALVTKLARGQRE